MSCHSLAKYVALASLVGATVLLSSCVEPPERLDPFVGLPSVNPIYKDLRLALVFTENTKRAMEYTSEYVGAKNLYTAHPFGSVVHGGQFFEDIVAVFRRNFKTVVKLEKAEDVQGLGMDIIAVLDVYAKFPNNVTEDASIEVAAIFLTTDHRQLDVLRIKGHGERSTVDLRHPVMNATNETVKHLDEAIHSSVKLTEFAKAKGGEGVIIAARPQGIPSDATGSALSEIDRLPVNDPRGVKVLVRCPRSMWRKLSASPGR